ncbi:hypothetical protein [uncultured Halomonas sp.]|uniref:hypothetical protein n=1 Tax=uncultured Halomonas sp. TaxID=173971 RepID=UPI002616A61F|nr:hypothetical protein [uncultured Halomonas sp.]
MSIFDLEGAHERKEAARVCRDVWLGALRQYYRDAAAAMRGVHTAHLEALDDLTNGHELLANLCRPVGADPDRVAQAMIEALDR